MFLMVATLPITVSLPIKWKRYTLTLPTLEEHVYAGFDVWGVIMKTNIKIYHASLPQSKLHMEGFRSLKEGEAVEFTFKKSAKGLESIRVTGPGGVFCIGSERRPKGKNVQKRRSKGDRYGLEGSFCGLVGMMSTLPFLVGPDAKDKVKPVAPGNIWMWEAKRGWYVWRVLHDLLFYLISN